MTFPELDEVLAILCDVSGLPEIDPDEQVTDLDIESIDLLEWLYVLEDQYGVVVEDTKLEQLQSTMSLREIYVQVQALASAGAASSR